VPQLIRALPWLLPLAACTAQPVETASFRDTAAPIYSSAVLEPSRLAGHWLQVATFAPGGRAECAPGSLDISGTRAVWDLCLPGGAVRGTGAMAAGKPGRFDLAGMPVWWVLWADADYRTLVVGTPSGEIGFVLNRDANLPGDRLKAVRDILDFNGYDTGQLAVF
jgi:apolipoprotein D and lipocalin family protein